jgi:hypothetical protein
MVREQTHQDKRYVLSVVCGSKGSKTPFYGKGTDTPGQKVQTRGPVSTREADVREETKESSRCFFSDLW